MTKTVKCKCCSDAPKQRTLEEEGRQRSGRSGSERSERRRKRLRELVVGLFLAATPQ
jgi:hypothetical protein